MEELKATNQWSPVASEKDNLKRLGVAKSKTPYKFKAPLGNPSAPKTFKTYTEAKTYAECHNTKVGYIFQKDDPYILLDIDVDPTAKSKQNSTEVVPPKIFDFLADHPTLVSWSSSGHGLHILYRVSKSDAAYLNAASIKKLVESRSSSIFKGEIFWHNCYVVLTENWLPGPTKIASVSLKDLAEISTEIEKLIIKPLKSNVIDVVTKKPIAMTLDPLVSIEEVTRVLELIPIEPNHVVTRAWDKLGCSTESYSHWLSVGMCLAYEAHRCTKLTGDLQARSQLAYLFDTWSASDTTGNYEGSDVTLNKFEQLIASSEKVSPEKALKFRTLKRLAQLCIINWPTLDSRNCPIHEDLANFDAVLDFFQLRLYEDTLSHQLYVEGPKDIVACFLSAQDTVTLSSRKTTSDLPLYITGALSIEQLQFGLLRVCQLKARYSNFKHSTAKILATQWLNTRCVLYNPIRYWIQSTPWDGQQRLDEYLETFHFAVPESEDTTMYQEYIKKSLLLIVARCMTDQAVPAGGIVILGGKENTHKTVSIARILPEKFREYFTDTAIQLGTLGNNKDAQMEVTSHLVLAVNEIDKWLTNEVALSELKSFVTRPIDTFRPPYGLSHIKRPRMAVLYGTTNYMTLRLSREGNRRIWFIPIHSIDIDNQNLIDRQQLFAEVLVEYKRYQHLKVKPWELTSHEVDITFELLTKVKSKNTLDLILEDLFNWEEPFDNDKFTQTLVTRTGNIKRNLLNKIEENRYILISRAKITAWLYANIQHTKITLPGVVRSLDDKSARWTHTLNDRRDIDSYDIHISNGKVESCGGHFYILPTLK